jgi:hypothetical protein
MRATVASMGWDATAGRIEQAIDAAAREARRLRIAPVAAEARAAAAALELRVPGRRDAAPASPATASASTATADGSEAAAAGS